MGILDRIKQFFDRRSAASPEDLVHRPGSDDEDPAATTGLDTPLPKTSDTTPPPPNDV